MVDLDKIADAILLTRTTDELGALLLDLSPDQRNKVVALATAKADDRLQRGETIIGIGSLRVARRPDLMIAGRGKCAPIAFHAFIRNVAKKAKNYFDRDKELDAAFIYENAAGERTTAVAPAVTSVEAKIVLYEELRSICAANSAVRCAFVAEAWVGDGEFTGAELEARRREAIMINAQDHREGAAMGMMEIVRPEGRAPYLLDLKIERFKECTGRMGWFLPASGTA